MNKHLLFIITILAIIFANSCSKEQTNEPLKFGVERYDSAAYSLSSQPRLFAPLLRQTHWHIRFTWAENTDSILPFTNGL